MARRINTLLMALVAVILALLASPLEVSAQLGGACDMGIVAIRPAKCKAVRGSILSIYWGSPGCVVNNTQSFCRVRVGSSAKILRRFKYKGLILAESPVSTCDQECSPASVEDDFTLYFYRSFEQLEGPKYYLTSYQGSGWFGVNTSSEAALHFSATPTGFWGIRNSTLLAHASPPTNCVGKTPFLLTLRKRLFKSALKLAYANQTPVCIKNV